LLVVKLKESHSYVFNTMFSAVNCEALMLAANGVATVEDIDRAWMGTMKMPIGQFGMMDPVGGWGVIPNAVRNTCTHCMQCGVSAWDRLRG
jgi:3-hydroxyacyl-CoA dehydrogenase